MNPKRTEAINNFFEDYKHFQRIIGFERMEKHLEAHYPDRPDWFWADEDRIGGVLEFCACWILDEMIEFGELLPYRE